MAAEKDGKMSKKKEKKKKRPALLAHLVLPPRDAHLHNMLTLNKCVGGWGRHLNASVREKGLHILFRRLLGSHRGTAHSKSTTAPRRRRVKPTGAFHPRLNCALREILRRI